MKAVPKFDVFSSTIGGSSELVAPLLGQGQADQAPALARHEVDRLRRHLLGREHEVALVLPVLVVHDDDELARAQVLDGLSRWRRR